MSLTAISSLESEAVECLESKNQSQEAEMTQPKARSNE